jgi:hypothetical protein
MKLQVSDPITTNITMFDSYIMDIMQPPDCILTMHLTSSFTSLDLWHHCLSHLHTNAITYMADEGLVTGMTISDREASSGLCKLCLKGKQTREVNCKVMTMHTEHVLSHVHTNICGPLSTPSHCSYRYFITFIDDSSHYTSTSPLWKTSEVRKLLKAFITQAELETG